jgi:hypothetical protein
MINRLDTFALTLSLLSGCGSQIFTGIDSHYPKTWPDIVTGNNFCKQLTGVYKNHGLATFSRKGVSPYLTYRFGIHFPTMEELTSIQTVGVNCNGETQQIVLTFNADTGKDSRTIALKDAGWRLEKDALYFPVENESDADGLGGHISKSEFRLAIGKDGSLIGEERMGGAGLALWLIPIAGTQTFWFQWPRATTGDHRAG